MPFIWEQVTKGTAHTPVHHCERLKLVFNWLNQPSLKLKLIKCYLLSSEVKFLGHVMSTYGIQVDQEKVQALEMWPSPKSVREVRQLLGFMSYYRRFVPRFAHLAQPLHAMVSRGSKGGGLLSCSDGVTNASVLLRSLSVA